MGNLKEVRNRITSVKSTQQITKAMKMVSAAKLRRAQQKVLKMRPYDLKLSSVLQNLAAQIGEEYDHPLFKKREPNRVLLVAITADRGLAGSFNSNVIKETMRLVRNDYNSQFNAGNLSIYSVGKKGRDNFLKYKYPLAGENNHIFNDLTTEEAHRVASEITQKFSHNEFDRIVLIFNQFRNAAVYNTQVIQLLPIPEAAPEEVAEKEQGRRVNYIFEPSMEGIMDKLIPLALQTTIHRALLDSNAAEHGARMTAMDKATENAEDLIKDLRLKYNKERQATITKELLDIVGGARALEEG
ncbi:MAG: ATP synthase F1 subunit gamma [Bacteroidia bacterium]